MDELKRVELFNGRAAMLGKVIGVIVNERTGIGIAHWFGLGAPSRYLHRCGGLEPIAAAAGRGAGLRAQAPKGV